MKNKSYLSDPSLYALLAINFYIIYYYTVDPGSIHSIIVIYWVQSVLIGLFNFVDLLTIKNVAQGSLLKSNNTPLSTGCSAFFFLFHYSFFHLGYLIFLVTIVQASKLDWKFVVITFWVLLGSMVIAFFRQRIRFAQVPRNVGYMFFLPYLRIVPMHLMILIPSFLHMSAYMVFLLLKTIFDLLMYVVSNRIMQKEVTGTTAVTNM